MLNITEFLSTEGKYKNDFLTELTKKVLDAKTPNTTVENVVARAYINTNQNNYDYFTINNPAWVVWCAYDFMPAFDELLNEANIKTFMFKCDDSSCITYIDMIMQFGWKIIGFPDTEDRYGTPEKFILFSKV